MIAIECFPSLLKIKERKKSCCIMFIANSSFHMIVGSVFAVTTPNCHGKRQSCKFHGSIKDRHQWLGLEFRGSLSLNMDKLFLKAIIYELYH